MTSGSRKLVIVESPAKARTISGFLGDDFDVEASIGHIRDLPQPSELPQEMKKGPFGKFAVNVDEGFEPYYVVDADKKKKVSELKKLLKEADELYLATDEDREGEAIAWHLLEVLRPTVPVYRMVFHEITQEAIDRALHNTRDVDDRLVDAQETRRILDRLYGYEVSPVLWRKVRAGLSAGRVQSVATRLVVERERERMAFVSAGYWDIVATLATEGLDSDAFSTRLVAVDGNKIAVGRDFNDRGQLTAASGVVTLDEAQATSLAAALDGRRFEVTSVTSKPYTRRPAAPFTTSTLQQEASRKLRMSARQAMRTAQSLYENGYITYMRTDSAALSTQAIGAARRQIGELYGEAYVPQKPRVYSGKSKNAQEAHEAIRPAGDHFRTPTQVSSQLRGDEFKLYELIWKRTVASQMADAKGSTDSVRIAAEATDGRKAEFAASGTVITFRGFLAAYEEGRDETRGETQAVEAERKLPQMTEGDGLAAREIEPEGHTTNPPPRYTEASLVKALEERGIGRPSTYAATISVIGDRGYVNHRGTALVPSWLAFSVTRLLEEYFGGLVDYDFTAEMEADLDQIAAGEVDRTAWLHDFYFGGEASEFHEGLRSLVDNLGDIDARDINSIPLGDDITLRVGRYGPYLEVPPAESGGDPRRASVPDDVAPDELTLAKAHELLDSQHEGDLVLGEDPATGRMIVAKSGRFGPYVTEVLEEPATTEPAASDDAKSAKKTAKKAKLKPRTASLFTSMSLDSITLADALRLLSLPRVVGVDPESGEEITAQNGRFGPYMKKGTDSRSLETEEQLFDITLEQALAIYAQPKQRRGATARPPLAELGPDPASGKPMVVKDGRFGPYVTDGETNATLRKDDDPTTITPERGAELLADKRARGPVKKRTKKTAKKTTKKAAAKKTTAKKTAAKKTPAEKTTAAEKTATTQTSATALDTPPSDVS